MKPKGGRASLQTFHALKASDLAAAMNEALQKVRISPGEYAPELMAPQGPSTAGGVQAMQHLRLVASQPGMPTHMVGYANHAEGKAELRTYDYVSAVYRQRFHRALDLDRAAYEAFVAFAQQVFTALHLRTSIVGPPPDVSADPLASAERRRLGTAGVVVLLVVLLGACAFGAWTVFVKR